MSDGPQRISVLIAAVGGQGGHILGEWLLAAARLADWQARGVGLPGLSQRGGATIYYLELAHGPEAEKTVFCPFPVSGDLDIILGQELLELVRAACRYGGDKCKIVGSTHRIYTVQERLTQQPELLSEGDARELLKGRCERAILFDASRAAREEGLDQVAANSVLLGALAASGFLPLSAECFEEAIRQTGPAPETNLRAFRAGVKAARQTLDAAASELRIAESAPYESAAERSLPRSIRRDIGYRAMAAVPQLTPIVSEAARQLTAYQSAAYARLYLAMVQAAFNLDIERNDGRYDLTAEFARVLAVRMTLEDMFRVAELKTDPNRFSQIRLELGAGSDEILHITDYLCPQVEQIVGALPDALARSLLRLLAPIRFRSLPMRVSTSSIPGYFLLRSMAALKFLRPLSWNFRQEEKWIRLYARRVMNCARADHELGVLAASAGELVKGYGDTRRKMLSCWNAFHDELISPMLEARATAPEILAAGREYLRLAFSSPEGPEAALRMARSAASQAGKPAPSPVS
jgi:indolepyruvate ferredoxin oxidoreductase beta subunit